VSTVEERLSEPAPTQGTDPKPSRLERKKARTVNSILDAAESEFLERGFHGVTVEVIADRADVAVGSIYVHFQSKEGLYLALLERAFEVEERYMAAAFDDSLPPHEQLFQAGEAYLRFYLENPAYFRVLLFPHFVTRSEDELPEAAQRLAERAEQQVARIAELLELGVNSKIARPMDTYKVAKFMLGAWSGVIALNLRPDRLRLDDDELRGVLEEGRRMLAEGIAAAALRNPDGSLKTEFAHQRRTS
jgi:AcrR family transcriptional regulator